MKAKSLIPLVIILVILALLILFRQAGKEESSIVEEAGLVSLFPEGLTKGDIVELELYAGPKPDEKVVLEWNADADGWQVPSHFNAPVKDSKIDELLDALVEVHGEFRATADADEELEQYRLKPDTAFNIVAYKKDSDQPAFHLLAGASPGYKTVFVRAADNKEVYVADTDFRRLAGLYGDDMVKAPEADAWLDKSILNLDKDNIDKIALNYPDKELAFAKETPAEQEKEQEEEAAGNQSEAEAETTGDDAGEEKPEPKWVLEKGGPAPEIKFKQKALDSLLTKLDSLTGNGVVDPEKMSEWGLDEPAYKCTVSFADDSPDVVIEGGRPDPGEDGYVRVATEPDSLVYKLSKYNYNQLWPKGSDLFDLPKVAGVNPNDIQHIEVDEPGQKVVVAKQDDNWNVEQPQADLEVMTNTIKTAARTLASWKAEDYAGSKAGTGLDSPDRKVTFAVSDGDAHTIALGNDSKSIDGAYAKLDENPRVLAMKKVDIGKIFIDPNDLYDRALSDFNADAVQKIHTVRGKYAYSLAREGEDEWKLLIDGKEHAADQDAVDDLAQALAGLEAGEIVFGESGLPGEAQTTIDVSLEGGKKLAVKIGEKAGEVYPVVVGDKAQLFRIASETYDAIAPASDSLEAPEPEPKQDTPETAEKDDAPPSPTDATEPGENQTGSKKKSGQVVLTPDALESSTPGDVSIEVVPEVEEGTAPSD